MVVNSEKTERMKEIDSLIIMEYGESPAETIEYLEDVVEFLRNYRKKVRDPHALDMDPDE